MADAMNAVSFESMNLQVGGRLQFLVVRDVKPVPYFSTLIGYVRNEYLILKAPADDKSKPPLREGDKLTVRVFSGVMVCTFNASLLRIFGAPLNYLHVSFPDEIVGANLRSAVRVRVEIPATLSNPADAGMANVSVVLSNISVTGTQIESQIEVGKSGETIELSFQSEGHAEGADMTISTRALIRNIGMRDAGTQNAAPVHLYGVQFLDLDPTHRLVLENMTYHAIVNGRQNIV